MDYSIKNKRGETMLLPQSYGRMLRDYVKELLTDDQIELAYELIPKKGRDPIDGISYKEFEEVYTVDAPARNV